MIPKVEASLDSLRDGVRKTHIIDGRVRHSLLLEMYTDTGIGTEIVLQENAKMETRTERPEAFRPGGDRTDRRLHDFN